MECSTQREPCLAERLQKVEVWQEEQEERQCEQVEVEQLEQVLVAPEKEMALESAPGRVLG